MRGGESTERAEGTAESVRGGGKSWVDHGRKRWKSGQPKNSKIINEEEEVEEER